MSALYFVGVHSSLKTLGGLLENSLKGLTCFNMAAFILHVANSCWRIAIFLSMPSHCPCS